MPDAPIQIVLVGHCGPDSYALRSAVGSMVPGAAVEFAADQAALQRSLPTARLLLINRTLDGEYDLQTGVELIRQLKDAPQPPRAALMLVSNFPEAQAEALAAGAVPGFGKRDMYSPETKRRILDAIAGS